MVTEQQVEAFAAEGFCLVRGLFSSEEAARYRDHFMELRVKRSYPGDFSGVSPTETDPLQQYPRMIHMHRWDPVSLEWLIEPRLNACMTALTGSEPLAVQTMLYFKPPGSRGQALHQDQFYLRTRPGTCLAAWMALDPCDEENGCLLVVPGTGELPVLCTQAADTTRSFTDVEVPVPHSLTPMPVRMEPGDVLFFNGSLIHGSLPNGSADRFRRALIGHYVVGEAQAVSRFYHPVLRMDGSVAALEESAGGGPCGTWVEQEGRPVVVVQEAA